MPVIANENAGNAGHARNGNDDYQESALRNARAGHNDDASPRTLDYEAMETILTDLLSCNGQTLLTSPALARQHLNDQQVQDLQNGRATANAC